MINIERQRNRDSHSPRIPNLVIVKRHLGNLEFIAWRSNNGDKAYQREQEIRRNIRIIKHSTITEKSEDTAVLSSGN